MMAGAGFMFYDDNTTASIAFPVVRYISDFSPYKAGEPDLQQFIPFLQQTWDSSGVGGLKRAPF